MELLALRNKVAEMERFCGQLSLENSILKSPGTVEAKCQIIEHLYEISQPEGWHYSIRGLCHLFDINRAWYYERQRVAARRNQAENEVKAVIEKLRVEFAGNGVHRIIHVLIKMGY